MPKPSSLKTYFRRRFIAPLNDFMADSRAIGITLIICTFFSLIISNSPWGDAYTDFWHLQLFTPPFRTHLPHHLLHIINDGLMTTFFFLAGLEIKRELKTGELSSIRKSMLPIVAAIGGMVVPALIYYIWCGQTPFSRGWGIPMATDIAFSLGILSLLGKRVPPSIRIFLTALAIIDDLGGILTIAIFYAAEVKWIYLAIAAFIYLIVFIGNLRRVTSFTFYLAFAFLLWYMIFNSGIHPTIAGVLMAFVIPLKRIKELEHLLHEPVSFIVLPLFALANTAIPVPTHVAPIYISPIHYGVFWGLLLGKPIGITLFSYLAVKFKLASLPEKIIWKQIIGTGFIAGIGFTMSIFMATLAFDHEEHQIIAKIAIIEASFVAGVVGFFFLKRLNNSMSVPKQ